MGECVVRAEADSRPLPRRWLAVPAAIAAVLLLIDAFSDADRALTRLIFDPYAVAFPLRSNFWLDVVMHHWTKYAVTALGCLLTIALLLSSALPALRPARRALLFSVSALALAPMAVVLGKAVSPLSCPWDIDEFGGLVAYTHLLDWHAAASAGGHCFPAGHASTGFALMAFYFVAYSVHKPRIARCALRFGMFAGLLLGTGRVLQGAHFASHVLWSGVVCWSVMALLYALILHARRVRRPVPSASVLTAPRPAG